MAQVPLTAGEQVASRITETVADLINRLAEAKQKKKQLTADLEDASNRVDKIESLLRVRMEAEGLTNAAATSGSVTLAESVVPQVEDWDKFHEFIWENRFFHMLDRRASVTGYREMYQMGKSVPGVLPYVKKRINFRET